MTKATDRMTVPTLASDPMPWSIAADAYSIGVYLFDSPFGLFTARIHSASVAIGGSDGTVSLSYRGSAGHEFGRGNLTVNNRAYRDSFYLQLPGYTIDRGFKNTHTLDAPAVDFGSFMVEFTAAAQTALRDYFTRPDVVAAIATPDRIAAATLREARQEHSRAEEEERELRDKLDAARKATRKWSAACKAARAALSAVDADAAAVTR